MNAYTSSLFCAALVTTLTGSALAAPRVPRDATYTITTTAGAANGTLVSRESLSLQREGDRTRLRLAAADGSVLVAPAALSADGEITTNAPDDAVTCYNMATSIAALPTATTAPPPVVYVRFGASVVPIALHPRAIQTRGAVRDLLLDGDSRGVYASDEVAVAAGIAIHATVEQDALGLRNATFAEVRYLGGPAGTVGRSTCAIVRSGGTTTARV